MIATAEFCFVLFYFFLWWLQPRCLSDTSQKLLSIFISQTLYILFSISSALCLHPGKWFKAEKQARKQTRSPAEKRIFKMLLWHHCEATTVCVSSCEYRTEVPWGPAGLCLGTALCRQAPGLHDWIAAQWKKTTTCSRSISLIHQSILTGYTNQQQQWKLGQRTWAFCKQPHQKWWGGTIYTFIYFLYPPSRKDKG